MSGSIYAKQNPKIVAKYGEYTITQGTTIGMFYAYNRDELIGMNAVLANAVSLISLSVGAGFDVDKLEVEQ